MNNQPIESERKGCPFLSNTAASRLWYWMLPFTLCLLLIPHNIAQAAPKEFPIPDWLDTVQVGEQMIINGVPSLVYHFETYKEIEELLEFYRKEWRAKTAKTPGYREAHVAPWHVISRLDNHYLYTVQVQQDGAFSIKGYLAVGDLKAMTKTLKNNKSVPLMSGSTVLNDVTSFDPGQKGRTLMAANKYSVASNSQFYRNYYLQRGWTTLMDSDSDDSFVMAFRKRNQETHLVINTVHGATHVVMNIVEGI